MCDRVPIPTSTLATYLRYGGSDPDIAAAVHGLVVEGVALTSFAITTWLIRQQLLDAAVSLSAARAAERRYAGGALAIVLAIGLAFISAVLALAIHMAIAMYFLAARDPFANPSPDIATT